MVIPPDVTEPPTIEDAVETMRKELPTLPDIAIILGSGLGPLTETIDIETTLPYNQVPGMAVSSVDGHTGRFVYGTLNSVPVLVMDGRIHYYETGEMEPVVLPVQILNRLGCTELIVSNAAGAINEDFDPGELMILEDHINMLGDNPLISSDEDGEQFPDMSSAYDPQLRDIAWEAAEQLSISVNSGVYVAMSGPSYETPAEVRMLETLGGDAVGMSTVPETIVANRHGMSVLGISSLTNYAAGLASEPLSHDEVKEVAGQVEEEFVVFVSEIVSQIASL